MSRQQSSYAFFQSISARFSGITSVIKLIAIFGVLFALAASSVGCQAGNAFTVKAPSIIEEVHMVPGDQYQVISVGTRYTSATDATQIPVALVRDYGGKECFCTNPLITSLTPGTFFTPTGQVDGKRAGIVPLKPEQVNMFRQPVDDRH